MKFFRLSSQTNSRVGEFYFSLPSTLIQLSSQKRHHVKQIDNGIFIWSSAAAISQPKQN